MTSTTLIETSIAIVSWNIGDNINEDKIHELVDAFKLKISGTDPLPDIIVFGFQEIPVPAKLNVTFKDKYYSEITGVLQSHDFLQNNYKVLPTDSYNPLYTCTTGLSKAKNFTTKVNHKVSVTIKRKRKSPSNTPKAGFGIASFVFVQKGNLRNISLNSTDKYCNKKGLGTKGWCTANLIIDDIPFSITNTHMPFQSLRATGNFAKRFLNHKNNKNKNNFQKLMLNQKSLFNPLICFFLKIKINLM